MGFMELEIYKYDVLLSLDAIFGFMELENIWI